MTASGKQLFQTWSEDWAAALKLWSPYLRLRAPLFLWGVEEEKKEGLTGSFAMIRFHDTQVVVSLRQVETRKLGEFGLSILAHEIGHHIYAPGDLTEHARMLARMKRMLPRYEARAPEIANLYTDLLINNRLKTRHDLPLEKIYETFKDSMKGSRLMLWYMRTYEILWGLPKRYLADGEIKPEEEGDAILASRIIRRFADHPVQAAGRYAALALSKLEEDGNNMVQQIQGWLDTVRSAEGSRIPEGLIWDDTEPEDLMHPSLDPGLNDLAPHQDTAGQHAGGESQGGALGQRRLPSVFVDLMRSLGMNITEEDAAMAYYREMAAPLLVPFPKRSRPPSTDPHPEGLDVWDVGRPLEKIDWLESVLRGPAVIPGFTTVERLEGEAPGKEKAEKPLLLDIYIDSSGSISNPRQNFSPLCLAGAILALSALRAGSRVRAVLWSGPGQVKPTNGFTRDQKDIFSVLTGYYGGGTAFPLLNMKEFYFNPSEKHRLLPGERVHILVISDEGVDTMLSEAEGMPEGKTVISSILDKAGGGGSLVLNLYQKGWVKSPAGKRFSEQGWVVTPMQSWEDTVSFARDFSKRTWGDKNG